MEFESTRIRGCGRGSRVGRAGIGTSLVERGDGALPARATEAAVLFSGFAIYPAVMPGRAGFGHELVVSVGKGALKAVNG